MGHDKYIYACNELDCIVEFVHVYIEPKSYASRYGDIQPLMDCPNCGNQLTFCEKIEHKEAEI